MAILNGWWVDDRTPDAVRTLEIEGWLDVLQDLSEAEVRDAWGSYQRNGARTASGRLGVAADAVGAADLPGRAVPRDRAAHGPRRRYRRRRAGRECAREHQPCETTMFVSPFVPHQLLLSAPRGAHVSRRS